MGKLTSISQICVWVDDIVTVIVVDLLIFWIIILLRRQRHELAWDSASHIINQLALTERITGTVTSFALMGGLGGGM